MTYRPGTTSVDRGSITRSSGIGDFNGDGTSDVLWRQRFVRHVGIWEMHNEVLTWHDPVDRGSITRSSESETYGDGNVGCSVA